LTLGLNGAQQGLKLCVDNSQVKKEGMKHQMRGANSGPTRHDFMDIFNNFECNNKGDMGKLKILSIYLYFWQPTGTKCSKLAIILFYFSKKIGD
jgi:hypothetical protein